MANAVLRLVPKRENKAQTAMRNKILADVLLAQRLEMVNEAQKNVDDAWDRVLMLSEGGEPDQMAVLDYEMALNDLMEAKEKANI